MASLISIQAPLDLDIISDIKFSPIQNQLLVSSWDGRVLLYDCSDVGHISMLTEFHSNVPILNIAYGLGNSTYVGGLDGTVRQIDYENLKIGNENIGEKTETDLSINNLKTIENQPHILAASDFNGKLQFIDTRKRIPILSRKLSNKIFCMDTTSEYLTVGMSGRRIEIYDHRNWNQPYQVRESGLKYQIKDLKNFPTGEGFAISSIDGRVAIEYFDPTEEIQSKKFAFKCHRFSDKQSQTDLVYPINSIAFNKGNNTLFTAGSDGYLCMWNWQKRKRIKQFPRFEDDHGNTQSIVKTDISFDNKLIGIATSDDSYKNIKSLSLSSNCKKPSKIYIKSLN